MVNQIYRPRFYNLAVSSCNGVVKAQEMAALDEASSIINSAQEKADEIRAAAQGQYELEKERGYLEGREKAEKEAFSRQISDQIFLDNKLKELEAGLVNVVMISVRKIFSGFDDIALCEKTVGSALQKLRQSNQIKISVSPALASHLEPMTDRLKAEFTSFQSMEIIEDSNISFPNFVVESNTGRIEFSLGSKLEELQAVITEVVTGNFHEIPGVKLDEAAA
ncbi:type III secretion protein L [Labrenzia sp. EL_142]|nr:type III secretion protein L [Labrenzia sp. EL_142]